MRLKNITITLDEQTAARARVEAAERGMSLSRYIGEVLREKDHGADAYAEGMRRYFANKFALRRRPGERYLTRDEAHERTGLRRQ